MIRKVWLVFPLTLAMSACGSDQKTANEPEPDTSQEVKEAGQAVGQEVEEGAEDVKEGTEKAADKVEDKVDDPND